MNPRQTGTWTEWFTPIPNPNGLPNPSHKQHCPERFAPIPKPNTKHLPKPYLKPLSKYIFNNVSLYFLFLRLSVWLTVWLGIGFGL